MGQNEECFLHMRGIHENIQVAIARRQRAAWTGAEDDGLGTMGTGWPPKCSLSFKRKIRALSLDRYPCLHLCGRNKLLLWSPIWEEGAGHTGIPGLPLTFKGESSMSSTARWSVRLWMHSRPCEPIFPILSRPQRAANHAAFWALVSLVTGYLWDFFPASEKRLPRDLAGRLVWGMLLAVGAFQPRTMVQTFSFSRSPSSFLLFAIFFLKKVCHKWNIMESCMCFINFHVSG